MNTILILALFATSITSLSLIDPPGWTIIFTPAFIKVLIPSAKGKKASEAAIEVFEIILLKPSCFFSSYFTAI